MTLRRNCKIVDVFPCVAVEELPSPEKISVNIQDVTQGSVVTKSPQQRKEVLNNLGLQDLDLDGCEVSDQWKDKLLQLVVKYELVFSRDKIDCGEAVDRGNGGKRHYPEVTQ